MIREKNNSEKIFSKRDNERIIAVSLISILFMSLTIFMVYDVIDIYNKNNNFDYSLIFFFFIYS